MLLSRYLSRPVLRSLAATSTSSLRLYQPIIIGKNPHNFCFSQAVIKQSIRKGQHLYVTLLRDKQRRGKSPTKNWFYKLELLCKKIMDVISRSIYFFKSILVLLGLVGSVSAIIFQLFGQNQFTNLIENKLKKRKEYMQIQKSRKKEQQREILLKNSNNQDQDHKRTKLELDNFQQQGYSYKDELQSMLNSMDNKLIFYIQSLIGSSVATNLRRLANKKTFRQDMSFEQKSKTLFKKLYYINLKEPASSNLTKDEDSEWGIAKDLNYLLTSIIATDQQKKGWLERFQDMLMTDEQLQKNKKPKNSILIIDQAQLLQSFLNDKKKKQKLEQVYQKIFYAQKNKNVMIYIIANNNSFFHRFNRQLESPNLEDYKYEFISSMSDQDIRNKSNNCPIQIYYI